MSEVDVVAVIEAAGAAAVGLQIVRMSRFQNRTKADKTLISVIAEMAFLSPWKQMRVSKPRLSYCDPEQQNGWGAEKTHAARPRGHVLWCSSVKTLKESHSFQKCTKLTGALTSGAGLLISSEFETSQMELPGTMGQTVPNCCVSVFADACLQAVSPSKTEACFS